MIFLQKRQGYAHTYAFLRFSWAEDRTLFLDFRFMHGLTCFYFELMCRWWRIISSSWEVYWGSMRSASKKVKFREANLYLRIICLWTTEGGAGCRQKLKLMMENWFTRMRVYMNEYIVLIMMLRFYECLYVDDNNNIKLPANA